MQYKGSDNQSDSSKFVLAIIPNNSKTAKLIPINSVFNVEERSKKVIQTAQKDTVDQFLTLEERKELISSKRYLKLQKESKAKGPRLTKKEQDTILSKMTSRRDISNVSIEYLPKRNPNATNIYNLYTLDDLTFKLEGLKKSLARTCFPIKDFIKGDEPNTIRNFHLLPKFIKLYFEVLTNEGDSGIGKSSNKSYGKGISSTTKKKKEGEDEKEEELKKEDDEIDEAEEKKEREMLLQYYMTLRALYVSFNKRVLNERFYKEGDVIKRTDNLDQMFIMSNEAMLIHLPKRLFDWQNIQKQFNNANIGSKAKLLTFAVIVMAKLCRGYLRKDFILGFKEDFGLDDNLTRAALRYSGLREADRMKRRSRKASKSIEDDYVMTFPKDVKKVEKKETKQKDKAVEKKKEEKKEEKKEVKVEKKAENKKKEEKKTEKKKDIVEKKKEEKKKEEEKVEKKTTDKKKVEKEEKKENKKDNKKESKTESSNEIEEESDEEQESVDELLSLIKSSSDDVDFAAEEEEENEDDNMALDDLVAEDEEETKLSESEGEEEEEEMVVSEAEDDEEDEMDALIDKFMGGSKRVKGETEYFDSDNESTKFRRLDIYDNESSDNSDSE
ncbi:hypothetical protein ABK040_010013 [Willaertia magna]